MWGFKKFACLVLSTWSAMFSLRSFKEAKVLMRGMSTKDAEKLNRMQNTGIFEMPDPESDEIDNLF